MKNFQNIFTQTIIMKNFYTQDYFYAVVFPTQRFYPQIKWLCRSFFHTTFIKHLIIYEDSIATRKSFIQKTSKWFWVTKIQLRVFPHSISSHNTIIIQNIFTQTIIMKNFFQQDSFHAEVLPTQKLYPQI